MKNHITSSPTLPPYIEEKLTNVALGDQDSVLSLRDAILKTFYPMIDDRCAMCGGTGLYRSVVGGREIEEGCDECCGSGRTTTKNDKEYRAALQIICGRRISPTEAIANLSASELAAAVLDGKLLNKL